MPIKPGSILLLFFSLCLPALLIGCSPKIVGLRKDPSFTYSAINEGQIIIGGVASIAEGEFTDSDRSSASELMKNQLVEKIKGARVSSAGQLINSMGKDPYSKMMEEYKSSGEISAAILNDLRTKVPTTRYLVLSRIEFDHVDKSRDYSEAHVIAQVRRTVTAKMDVYDLRSGTNVWSGSLSNPSYRMASYQPKKDSLLLAVVKAAASVRETEDTKYPYPSTPRLSECLEEAYSAFAKNFPEA